MFDGVPEGFGTRTTIHTNGATVISLPLAGRHRDPNVYCLLYDGGRTIWQPLPPTSRNRSWRVLATNPNPTHNLRRTRSQTQAYELSCATPVYPAGATIRNRTAKLPHFVLPGCPLPGPIPVGNQLGRDDLAATPALHTGMSRTQSLPLARTILAAPQATHATQGPQALPTTPAPQAMPALEGAQGGGDPQEGSSI